MLERLTAYSSLIPSFIKIEIGLKSSCVEKMDVG